MSINRKLDEIIEKLEKTHRMVFWLLRKEINMTIYFDALAAQVKANTDLEASAILAFQGIADQIKASANDPEKIMALTAELHDSAAKLAAAIPASTPAATPPPPAATPPAASEPPAAGSPPAADVPSGTGEPNPPGAPPAAPL